MSCFTASGQAGDKTFGIPTLRRPRPGSYKLLRRLPPMSGPALPYDPTALAELQAVNPDDGGAFVAELVEIYLRDTPQLIGQFRQAVAAADFPDAARAAHTVKGSSGTFGAARMVEVARRAEEAARECSSARLAAALEELTAAYAELAPALEPLLGSRRPPSP